MNNQKIKCSQCGRLEEFNRIFYVDNASFCSKCLYGDIEPFEIYPIGYVRNNFYRKSDKNHGRYGDHRDVSRIELFPSQKPFMYKLEEEDTLTIVYYFHEAKPPESRFRRKFDLKEVGIFASHSPDRLSRIAVTEVNLLKIEGLVLYVTDLDAIDGTPVLDIKAPGGSKLNRARKSSHTTT